MIDKKILNLLDTKPASAKENMDVDAALLETLDPYGPPILHLYEWEKPSLTYGYFIAPEKLLNLAKLEEKGIDFAKRPTGGGIVFHIWDLAFSFLMPNQHPGFTSTALQSYHFVNQIVLEALETFASLEGNCHLTIDDFPSQESLAKNFCMAKPTKYDVIYRGKKLAGAAQRRKERGYLHQGTISLALPDVSLLQEVLLTEKGVLDAMQLYSFSLLNTRESLTFLQAKQALKKVLSDKFMEKFASFR